MSVSRVPIVAALVCSISCGSEVIPPLPPPPPSLPSPVDRLVGCYETTSDRPSPPSRYGAPWELPRAFYLEEEVYKIIHIDGRPVALRRVRQTESYRVEGFWRLTDPETIQVRWTNGFEDLRATLRLGSTDEVWRGSTVYTDAGPTPRAAILSVRRVSNAACAGSR